MKDKGTIEANKNKLRRSLESIKAKDIQSYDILGALVRLKVKEAKSIIASIKNSYKEFGGTPDKEIEKIQGTIEASESFSGPLDKFKAKYPLTKISQIFSGDKLNTLNEAFKMLVEKYSEQEFGVESIDEVLEKYSCVIKGLLLVDGQMVSGKSKNLNTWVRVLASIEAT